MWQQTQWKNHIPTFVFRPVLKTKVGALWLAIAMAGIPQDYTMARPLEPFAAQFIDGGPFLAAIEKERLRTRPYPGLTGITVPHHLLAADLIARAFWAASATSVDRVVILSPDHFSAAHKPFATSLRSFRTAFGEVATDKAGVVSLLDDTQEFENSILFRREHGVGAVLPFVAYFFPRARIIPIAIAVRSSKEDWDRAVERLLPLIGSRTLVVQSTDFSHYLPATIARQRDQETLNVLSSGDTESVADLLQSDHLDSKAGQYIQMRLQAAIGSTGPVIVSNRNSEQYTQVTGSTTSYIVQLYGRLPMFQRLPTYSDQQVVFFGGDVLLGRYLIPMLSDPIARKAILEELVRTTDGAPLIVNLEGVALDEPPEGLGTDQHVMPSGLAAPILKQMNVIAASLANNHSFDLGPIGLAESVAMLERIGIKPVRHNEIVDFGAFRLLALNFISKRQIEGFPTVGSGDLQAICQRDANPPLLAFVHWGREYTIAATNAEHEAASGLLDCGVQGIIGAHSHRASYRIEAVRGGAQQIAFSLGNLLFDQNGNVGSGALLELRVFQQGTFATRLVPIPNLYDLGHQVLLERAKNTEVETSSERSRAD
jgi:poly-gamma-glutamate synthesis protein (capsule biosynthesis protein)